MRATLSKWRALSGADQWLLTKICWWLAVVRLRIAISGVKRSLAWAQGVKVTASTASGTEAATRLIDRNRRLVNIAAGRGPVSASCLPQSLVLCRLLRISGVDARIRIGVRKCDNDLDAHAWVEVDGMPIEEGTETYRSFTEDPSQGDTANRP